MPDIDKLKKLGEAVVKYEGMMVQLRELFLSDDGKIDEEEGKKLSDIRGYIDKIKTRIQQIQDSSSNGGANTNTGTSNKIDGTVGKGGNNDAKDVELVQKLLKGKGYTIAVDGDCGPQTIGVIKQFQAAIFNGWSDGLIEPGKTTWTKLTGTGGEAGSGGTQDTNAGGNVPSGPVSKPNWIKVAEGELGVKEIVGSAHNPRVVEYHSTTGGWKDDETPWCASFVTWVMKKAGVDGGFGTAWANSWKNFGKATDGNKPAYGAVGVLARHVGFVVGKQGNHILLLGGNQGNMVKISKYSVSKFVAFRFPNSYDIPAN
ncbi:MAG: TIGR02594 family protein, partial [Saprospiraceae bacterium]|nr:TIGR02594 family protein [Saprospiraceae bacterium]